MNRPYLVGITGGIGSGKSTIAAVFQLLGVPVYDADSRAKWLMSEDSALISEIKKNFGDESYIRNQLNRQYLAERVFASEEATAQLNALVHPAVARDFSSWVQDQQSLYVLKEAALLFEAGSYKALDKVIFVKAPESMRLARILKRDPQRSEQQIRNIIHKQMNQEEAAELADEILNNDGGKMLLPQIIDLDAKIKRAIR